MSLIGARVLRKEDPNLITGRGQFVDDLAPAGMVVMVFVTSTEPHSRIVGIDTSEALALPGVLAVWTAADLDGLPPLGLPGLGRPLLATDVVRFVGEPVAVVVAEDKYLAADAAGLVLVDYESLPAAASLTAALADGAPALHEVLGGNTVFEQPFDDDLAVEFAAAPHTASLHIVNNRCAAVPIEPNACLADWGPSGLTLWATFQAPHHLRNTVATYFGIPQDTTRVVTPDVGGGFGAKINFVPEYFLACALSRLLARPVKYTQTRSECQLLMYHGRAQEQDVDVAFDGDGKLLALRVRVTQDQGAYPDPTGMGLPVLTTAMSAGCYKIPKVAVSWRNVVTNTTPVAAYRGAGRPEASYLIERIIDIVADQTGVDAVEVRRRNYILADEFPYATHSPLAVYDSGNFAGAMDELLTLFDYDGLKAEQARRRDDASKKLIGIGFSSWLEIAAFGPPGSLEAFGHLASWESVQIRVQPDGSAIIYTGASPHGQGTVTTFAQIAAGELGIPFEKISVRHGDTATIPQGIGTMGSRATAVGGEGVRTASVRVVERAKAIAARDESGGRIEAVSDEQILAALRAGASGYVVKKSDVQELLLGIQSVHRGNTYFSSAISDGDAVQDYLWQAKKPESKTGYDLLTSREREVLQLIAEGYSNQRIATELFISVKTVEAHKAHIMSKLHAQNRTDLIRYAIRKGIVGLDSGPDLTDSGSQAVG